VQKDRIPTARLNGTPVDHDGFFVVAVSHNQRRPVKSDKKESKC
jgi:hypothetical protein